MGIFSKRESSAFHLVKSYPALLSSGRTRASDPTTVVISTEMTGDFSLKWHAGSRILLVCAPPAPASGAPAPAPAPAPRGVTTRKKKRALPSHCIAGALMMMRFCGVCSSCVIDSMVPTYSCCDTSSLRIQTCVCVCVCCVCVRERESVCVCICVCVCVCACVCVCLCVCVCVCVYVCVCVCVCV